MNITTLLAHASTDTESFRGLLATGAVWIVVLGGAGLWAGRRR